MIDLKDFELFQVSKSVYGARIPWDHHFLKFYFWYRRKNIFKWRFWVKWITKLPMIMSVDFRFQPISSQMVGVWPTNETFSKTFYGFLSFLLSDCDPFG